jgi:hypothetical protein
MTIMTLPSCGGPYRTFSQDCSGSILGALVATGEIPSLHIGRQLRIPSEGPREWIRRQAGGAERVR